MGATRPFIVALALMCVNAATAHAQPAPSGAEKDAAEPPDPRESMCLMIESAARAYQLPLEFFARVIWQESSAKRFRVSSGLFREYLAEGLARRLPASLRLEGPRVLRARPAC